MSVFSRGRRLILSVSLSIVGLLALGRSWPFFRRRFNLLHHQRPIDVEKDFNRFISVSSLLLEIPKQT